MILESIVNDEKSGLISQLAELTYYFLGKNRNYASRVFNTIIMLAEDEMNHQKFNAVYIKNHNDAEYEFIPNMVPKLRGVDYWIRENKGNEYQNKRSEIIQEYLYDGKGGDMFTVGYGCARLFLPEGSDFLEQIALRVGAFLYAFLHSRGSLQSTYERLLEMVY